MTSRNEWYRKKLAEMRAERGNACERCKKKYERRGKNPNLQFAHLRPTGLCGEGRGQSRRVLDIRKHKDAYLLLCVDCHRLLDEALET